MIYGYIRVISDKQTVENQRFEIGNFCEKNSLTIDVWVEETISVIKEKYDIIISLLNETRRFHLPDKLKTRKISEYSYKNGELKINMDYE